MRAQAPGDRGPRAGDCVGRPPAEVPAGREHTPASLVPLWRPSAQPLLGKLVGVVGEAWALRSMGGSATALPGFLPHRGQREEAKGPSTGCPRRGRKSGRAQLGNCLQPGSQTHPPGGHPRGCSTCLWDLWTGPGAGHTHTTFTSDLGLLPCPGTTSLPGQWGWGVWTLWAQGIPHSSDLGASLSPGHHAPQVLSNLSPFYDPAATLPTAAGPHARSRERYLSPLTMSFVFPK